MSANGGFVVAEGRGSVCVYKTFEVETLARFASHFLSLADPHQKGEILRTSILSIEYKE
jgi:hypothetical protein